MKIYNWRKNFTAFYTDEAKTIKGKLAFKTKRTDWLETNSPVIVLISVHSAFHDNFDGDLKMNALISTIKNHVRGPVTVLLTDKAHVHTTSLRYENNLEKAFEICVNNANTLARRYQQYFETCNVAYWHTYVGHDTNFAASLNFIKQLYYAEAAFRELLHADAHFSYTPERRLEFTDKALYIQKAINDILEQCACNLVLANKGYKFQFYPGQACKAVDYLNRKETILNKQISWIDVFLSIEKKSIKTQLEPS